MINVSFQSLTYYCEGDQDGGGRVSCCLAEVAATVVLRNSLDLQLPVLRKHCRQDTTSGRSHVVLLLLGDEEPGVVDVGRVSDGENLGRPLGAQVSRPRDLSQEVTCDHVPADRKFHVFLLTMPKLGDLVSWQLRVTEEPWWAST